MPTVFQYWDSEQVPGYLDEAISSFRELNPELRHALFDERRAAEFIATRIGEREAAAFRACAVPTMQSDFFRYCAMYACGGVYADVGFRCIAPLGPLLDELDGGQVFRVPPGYLLSGLLLFSAPGHPLPRLVLDVITANVERRAAELVQMVTGPWSLTALSVLAELLARERSAGPVAERRLSSLAEPFRREAEARAPAAAGRRAVAGMIPALFDAVGDPGRVVEAFERVRIAPYEATRELVADPAPDLPYKRSDRYWINWQGRRSIFR